MTARFLTRISSLALAGTLAACALPGANNSAPPEIRMGRIEQISATQLQDSHQIGVGAIVGGLGGLAVGSLIGNGNGRDVARVVGAIGGAVAGNEVQKRYEQPVAGQQIIVRTGSGVLVSVTQPVAPDLRVGQNVFIEGSGESARVIPR
ncbi:glycine zipper 2TM domain-containing protein [Variovorax rhizosphaerae]|uniref:Glycine zipper 2TM domain-containing protein n=1 Tax=Variovorax rhizosphaerae TaxID=1836200 RepID=A0ABU8WFT9_9BURK